MKKIFCNFILKIFKFLKLNGVCEVDEKFFREERNEIYKKEIKEFLKNNNELVEKEIENLFREGI